MKKSILISATVVCLFIISISGCKRDIQLKEENKNEVSQQTVQNQSNSLRTPTWSNISLSRYGFLVFPKVADFNDYRAFLLSSTHSRVQKYLAGLGFNSNGATLYGAEYATKIVTEEQSINYIFNIEKVFQVENAIMKPIGEVNAEVKWQFLLLMTPEYLTNTSYEKLAAGIFDANSMNQFATNPVNESRKLFGFITNTPTGYKEPIANPAQTARPMFGSITNTWTECSTPYYSGSGNCVRGCQDMEQTTTYIFWIGFRGEQHVIGSYEVAAVGC